MWRYAAAKATGLSHIRGGIPCQDHFFCNLLENNFYIFALADGAGSAKYGEEGAIFSVNAFIQYVSTHISQKQDNLRQLIIDAVTLSRNQVISSANEMNIEPREYASTLLTAIIGPKGGAVSQIGDGVIAISDGDNHWGIITWPQHGEFVNTTRFLTDDDALNYVEVDVLQDTVSDIVMMSDGLERLALDFKEMKAHEPFFNGLIKELMKYNSHGEITELSSKIEEFLLSERITSRTDDDTSLIIATRRDPLSLL